LAENIASDFVDQRKKKRCYHRVISGLQRKGCVRFVTLTSSDNAPCDIQHSFRKLMWRLRRRGLVQDYIKVIEVADDGRQHIHMAFRGQYIDQQWLSMLWVKLHLSPVVDIRQLKNGKRDKKRAANYLAKYMAKEACRRYSWSKNWVYPGFIKVWVVAKRIPAFARNHFGYEATSQVLINAWQYHLFNDTLITDFLFDLYEVFLCFPPPDFGGVCPLFIYYLHDLWELIVSQDEALHPPQNSPA
jgi:hypothetical protein